MRVAQYLTWNVGLLGASLTPYIATRLATEYGLEYVGYYLRAAAMLTIAGLLAIRETKNRNLVEMTSINGGS